MNRLLRPLAVVVLAAAASNAQESGKPKPRGGPAKSPLTQDAQANEENLTVATYTPRVFSSEELQTAASQLFGSQVTVHTDDGAGNTGFYALPHFVQLGELLIVRDSQEAAKRIVALLSDLEEHELARQKRDESAGSPPDGPVEATETIELRPRYVSVDTIERTLGGFRRTLLHRTGSGDFETSNLTSVPDGNFLLVTETPKLLGRIRELVASVDRPQPQMSMMAMLISPSGERELPNELRASLAELLPGEELRVASVGVLRCSTQAGKQCELRMDLGNSDNWSLTFFPEAFNDETNELTLTHCQFRIQQKQPDPQPPSVQEFTTSLLLKAGEYVVLGAVGTEPTFVVLRAQAIATGVARGK